MRTLKNRLLVALLALIGVLSAGTASAGQCHGTPKPLVNFKATSAKTEFNVSNSAWNLTGRMETVGGITLGLTYPIMQLESQTKYAVYDIGGSVCVTLDAINVFFRVRPIVYVSNEFPRGTCEFKEVLFHENKHVKVVRKFQKESIKPAKQYVQDVISQSKTIGPIPAWQAQAAMKKLDKELQDRFDSYITDLYQEEQRRQIVVDSPTEYDRVAAKCDNWDKRLRLE